MNARCENCGRIFDKHNNSTACGRGCRLALADRKWESQRDARALPRLTERGKQLYQPTDKEIAASYRSWLNETSLRERTPDICDQDYLTGKRLVGEPKRLPAKVKEKMREVRKRLWRLKKRKALNFKRNRTK